MKRILIDGGQAQEVRVALIDENNQIEDLDFELQNGANKQIKGNIYLAKVLRVEPSLQAVFVDYGNERQGFLSFPEIHPDYFQIPKPQKKEVFEVLFDTTEHFGRPQETETKPERSENLHRKYTVQQVIKPKQILLVQVIKEERGNKCAALTTYISLAGRYCILMPNTPNKMGISRKIQTSGERNKLKEVVADLNVDESMSLVVRTAGDGKGKREIGKDYEYLLKMWQKISANAKEFTAPKMIHEESCLIKRTIRDMYNSEVGEIVVEGDEPYKNAKSFMRSLIPSHVKNIKNYQSEGGVGLFQHYGIEEKLDTIYSPRVDLPSGGYIVINHTEALIAIDINSGKATRERNIEETAIKTNIEAAEEICRQMIVRNLSGIIIVDFIDMESFKNRERLEHAMMGFLKNDRARTQISKISKLGLMEISRQMLKPSIIQSKSSLCPHCGGLGYIQTSDTVGMRVIRALQTEIARNAYVVAQVRTTLPVAMNILNNHRVTLNKIEQDQNVRVEVNVDAEMTDCKFEITGMKRSDEVDLDTDSDVLSAEPIEFLNAPKKSKPDLNAQKPKDQDGHSKGAPGSAGADGRAKVVGNKVKSPGHNARKIVIVDGSKSAQAIGEDVTDDRSAVLSQKASSNGEGGRSAFGDAEPLFEVISENGRSLAPVDGGSVGQGKRRRPRRGGKSGVDATGLAQHSDVEAQQVKVLASVQGAVVQGADAVSTDLADRPSRSSRRRRRRSKNPEVQSVNGVVSVDESFGGETSPLKSDNPNGIGKGVKNLDNPNVPRRPHSSTRYLGSPRISNDLRVQHSGPQGQDASERRSDTSGSVPVSDASGKRSDSGRSKKSEKTTVVADDSGIKSVSIEANQQPIIDTDTSTSKSKNTGRRSRKPESATKPSLPAKISENIGSGSSEVTETTAAKPERDASSTEHVRGLEKTSRRRSNSPKAATSTNPRESAAGSPSNTVHDTRRPPNRRQSKSVDVSDSTQTESTSDSGGAQKAARKADGDSKTRRGWLKL